MRRTAAVVATALVLAGCGTSGPGGQATASHHDPSTSGMSGMSGMDGLGSTVDGYTLELRRAPMAGMPMPVSLVITKDGSPVTDVATEQAQPLHLYLIRDDLTGFQHLHPTTAADGTWSVTPAALKPGSYRLYAQVTPAGRAEPIVLSVPVKAGSAKPTQLPPPSLITRVDGYTVALDTPPQQGGQLRISFTKGGAPAELDTYLDTYADVTAFHAGDLAFAHLDPMSGGTNGRGGSALTFTTELPETGSYRMFVQFKAGGTLHTAAFTVDVG